MISDAIVSMSVHSQNYTYHSVAFILSRLQISRALDKLRVLGKWKEKEHRYAILLSQYRY